MSVVKYWLPYHPKNALLYKMFMVTLGCQKMKEKTKQKQKSIIYMESPDKLRVSGVTHTSLFLEIYCTLVFK